MTHKLIRKKSPAFLALQAQVDIMGDLEDLYSNCYYSYSEIKDPDNMTTEEEKKQAAAFYEARDKLEEVYQEFFRRYDRLTIREKDLLEADYEMLPFSYMYGFNEKFRAVTKYQPLEHL